MTARGAGTNLSGGTIPDSEESVVILTQSLNRILEINLEDLYAVVEPGVVTAKFAEAVAAKTCLSARPGLAGSFDARRQHCRERRRAARPKVRRDKRLPNGN